MQLFEVLNDNKEALLKNQKCHFNGLDYHLEIKNDIAIKIYKKEQLYESYLLEYYIKKPFIEFISKKVGDKKITQKISLVDLIKNDFFYEIY